MKSFTIQVSRTLSCLLGLLALSSCASWSRSGGAGDPEQWVAVGASALEEGDSSGALQSLARAEELGSKSPALHHVRALAYLQRKDLAPALESARRAHELAPRDSRISTTYGKLLMDAGRSRDAETVLLPAANDPLYAESYRARTNLAILYLARGQDAQASEQLERAINESPQQACHAYYFRSQMSQKSGRLRESLKDLDRATQGPCAGLAEAHLGLGMALARDRQYEKARRKFVEVSQRFRGTDFAEKALENLGYLP